MGTTSRRKWVVSTVDFKNKDWHMTDPTSLQRGRPKNDKTVTLRKNLWSKVLYLGSTPRHTDWLTVSRNMTLTLTLNGQLCELVALLAPRIHWIGGWVGPKARIHALGEKKIFPLSWIALDKSIKIIYFVTYLLEISDHLSLYFWCSCSKILYSNLNVS
jgi:hypothetical protein